MFVCNNLIRTNSRLLNRYNMCCYLSSQSETPKSIVKQQSETLTSEFSKPIEKHLANKEDFQVRAPWNREDDGKYFRLLRSMSSADNQISVMKWLQTPINLSPTAIKNWLQRRREEKEIFMQQYLPDRNRMLGNELAAAHFTVHRGGAVKFYNDPKWYKQDEFGNYELPRFFQSDKVLEGIDCSNMNLYYEGLSNFKDLKQVQWLSFNSVQHCDDWYLDRISNLFSHSLIYLDIRHCPKYTDRGLGALYKMPKLKILCIDDMLMTTKFEMTCLMLQDLNPELDIRVGDGL